MRSLYDSMGSFLIQFHNKQDHLLFLRNASADKIATAVITPPDISYISSDVIPDPEGVFLTGGKVIVFNSFFPLTDDEPDDGIQNILTHY